MACTRPPVTLCEFAVLATWSRRWAAATRCVPTPLTRTRRKVRLMGLPSTSGRVVVPNFVAGLAALTNASASMTATAFATHGAGSPTQLPAAQVSRTVQASPSSQAVPSGAGGFEHVPVARSHVPGEWHWSWARHTTAVPVQDPAWQVSPVVHTLPSEHAVPFATGTGFGHTPVAGSQLATAWHWSGAGHTVPAPLHTPAWHVSPVVQALPSLHAVPLATGGFEQVPAAGSQVPAAWHWSRAVHTTAVPAQVPARQLSPVVHALASEHAVPSATSGFEQVPVTRSQVPAVWHWSRAAQSTAVPVQAPA